VGGKNTIPLNIRIIAATSEDLDAEVADGSFLSALFFRLNVVRLQIPSLRERKNDIPLLINHFIHQMNGSFHRNISRIDPAALDMILEHCWPGNIRELKNCIESAFNFCDTETITPDCLNLPVPKPCSLESPKVKPNSLEAVNMQMISESLEQFGTVKEAAAHLDIPLSTFYRKMKSYGLSK
jgi:DNA-binding NtrC family response regulator